MNPTVEEKKPNGDVVIDIDDDSDSSRNRESSNGKSLCRICQESSGVSRLIKLGCDCRGGIGFLHQNCAAAWFSIKGNNVCEICGKTVKNIIIVHKEVNIDRNNNATTNNINGSNINNSNNDNGATETMSAMSESRPVFVTEACRNIVVFFLWFAVVGPSVFSLALAIVSIVKKWQV